MDRIRGRWTAAALCAAASSMAAGAEAPSGWRPDPFTAQYVAEWRDIAVGTSELRLERDLQPGHFHYRWTISARGVFRLVYSHDVTQQSWFEIVGDRVLPGRYRGEEGASFVAFEFDWESGHARGTSEGKPIDIPLQPGTQDLMSIQVQLMLDLQAGSLPPTFPIIDKDRLKEFFYTLEGPAKLRTAVGTLDTLVVASRRNPTDSRVLRMWFAPSLGCVPVQAERSRDGRLEFAMRIRKLER